MGHYFNTVNPVSSDLNIRLQSADSGSLPVSKVASMSLSARSIDGQDIPASKAILDCSPFRAGLHDAHAAVIAFSNTIAERKPGFLRQPETMRIVGPESGYASVPESIAMSSRTVAPAVKSPPPLPPPTYVGVCRHCGCTPEYPCHLQNGDECFWLTPEADLCSNKPCATQMPRPKR